MISYQYLSKILGLHADLLETLDRYMAQATGKTGVLEKVTEDNRRLIKKALIDLDPQDHWSTQRALHLLKEKIAHDEQQLLAYLQKIEGENQFEKAASLSRKIARVGKGFFLKKKYGEEILKKSTPHNLLKFLGYATVDEMLRHHDVTEAFSALRFIESDEWMHETFEKAYSSFVADDFEERAIEIEVLGPQWHEIAKKFVEKKHHNVSHLKEFGVIFLNPIAEDLPGKFLRDFALLFHYFHEIEFYAKLFKKYAPSQDFTTHLKSLLRGDVKEVSAVDSGEWLIVQRYLWKMNPNDPRIFLPRVNPESLHWRRGERDLTTFGAEHADIGTEFWENYDWVADFFNDDQWLVSFDMEDNAMALVSEHEGKPNEYFTYHQREAMWTHIFQEYVGGEAEMERLLLEHFQDGSVKF